MTRDGERRQTGRKFSWGLVWGALLAMRSNDRELFPQVLDGLGSPVRSRKEKKSCCSVLTRRAPAPTHTHTHTHTPSHTHTPTDTHTHTHMRAHTHTHQIPGQSLLSGGLCSLVSCTCWVSSRYLRMQLG